MIILPWSDHGYTDRTMVFGDPENDRRRQTAKLDAGHCNGQLTRTSLGFDDEWINFPLDKNTYLPFSIRNDGSKMRPLRVLKISEKNSQKNFVIFQFFILFNVTCICVCVVHSFGTNHCKFCLYCAPVAFSMKHAKLLLSLLQLQAIINNPLCELQGALSNIPLGEFFIYFAKFANFYTNFKTTLYKFLTLYDGARTVM